ncbi:hypothetical protein [Lachnobacterium bovis]|uniref:SdpI/YhfL protein family protein n=1 Tax=Lachnobacterium bovis TaxID=140626 RepID=A0A1H9S1G8_9FIRM|nr:hypothetical protein [Lachnobacterium bovis]SER78475.1 hypothetical protein SAMN02910429_01077 [Lachnobacterium bovis]
MAATIIYFTIYTFCTLIFVLIGVASYHSVDPVAINSNEIPPKKDELLDVSKWNHAHGWLWISFSIMFFLTGIIFKFTITHYSNEAIQVCIYMLLVGLEIAWIEIRHKMLKRKLIIKNTLSTSEKNLSATNITNNYNDSNNKSDN